MSIKQLVREWKQRQEDRQFERERQQRIRDPKNYDHCSYLLLGIMGGDWWIANGFYREYLEGRCLIDLAQPEMKLAIEGDGREFHGAPMDVLRDERRDKFLRSRGWYVLRFRYEDLKGNPRKVRAKILETHESFAGPTPEQIKVTRKQMKRSGMIL